METRETYYRNGEQVRYTGASYSDVLGVWYEIVIVADSHRVGTKLVTQRAPKSLEGSR